VYASRVTLALLVLLTRSDFYTQSAYTERINTMKVVARAALGGVIREVLQSAQAGMESSPEAHKEDLLLTVESCQQLLDALLPTA
jgi:hypothetical protein